MRIALALVPLALLLGACEANTDKALDEDLPEDTGARPIDADGDGYRNDEDCDDAEATINPGAAEVCDGIDNDCDGVADEGLESTWYADVDGDGYGNADDSQEACEQPEDTVATGTDCDDNEATVYPSALELCDGLDNDCDGDVDEEDHYTWFPDTDGDGYGDPEGEPVEDCVELSGYAVDSSDCDDTDPAVNPDASEVCNEVDDDCDGTIDEGVTTTFYLDSDGDGYGEDLNTEEACSEPSGFSEVGGDCDDEDLAVYPSAVEFCDEVDSDCDGDLEDPDSADISTWYSDSDGDGYGAAGTDQQACDQPSGMVADDTDCDDSDSEVNPGAVEICNEVDDDCDSDIDDDDADLDSSTATTWYADDDGDGEGDASSTTVSCDQPADTVADDSDCDDSDSDVNTSATEVCDEVDNDCDGATDDADSSIDTSTQSTWYDDSDEDGYGDASDTTLACEQPSGTVSDATDCDDTSSAINPGEDEVCNEVDDDCDGDIDDDDSGVTDQDTWYADDDSDGYGDASDTSLGCDQPTGHVSNATDCDDSEAAINPGASEECNEVDDDCDGDIDDDDASLDTSTADSWWPDDDLDGYGDVDGTALTACEEPSGYVDEATDCDDSDSDINTAATEDCNGYDDDCDGDADDSSVCPCDVEYYDSDTSRPYMYCQSSLNWANAQAACATYDYHLLSIDDADEDSWADTTADSYSTGYWWFGFNDLTTEGSWEWDGGSASAFSNWHSGEPNNQGNEDCGELNRWTDGTWNDEGCSRQSYYICEYD